MNHRKITNSTFLKTKANWWTKILFWGFIVSIGITIISCEKDNNNINNDSDEYYVKYKVNSTTIYSGAKLDVTINTENNQNIILLVNQDTQWETVIGPVQKGFNATLKAIATGETYNKLKLYSEIHVNKNDSPFALKEIDGSDTPRDSVQISYTIDY